jgi:fumarylacetoacetase
VAIGDYVDFYSSLEHATNLGRLFRPTSDPLMPNWRHLPVGYHGRAGSVVVSGAPVRRPLGQRPPAAEGEPPTFGPSERLDIELELGFLTGPGNELGTPIAAAGAAEHIFGFVLVNDWSARDLQRWEYQPLGPFLGKSFATSMSAWVVPLAAVEPFLVPAPPQDPEPLPYLRVDGDWALDLALEIELDGVVVSHGNARGLYWTFPQQLAHATVNGANARPGDLFASGTISGSEHGSEGSLIELTRGGREPLELPGGERRSFLEDGDTVVLRGRCGDAVAFGEVAGTILPATG